MLVGGLRAEDSNSPAGPCVNQFEFGLQPNLGCWKGTDGENSIHVAVIMPIAGSAQWVEASHGEFDPQLLKRRGEGRFAKLTSEVRLDAKERKGSNDVLASRVSRDHAGLREERGGEVAVAFGLDRIDRNDRVGDSWTDPIGLARQKEAVSSPIAELEVDGADEIDGIGPWGS